MRWIDVNVNADVEGNRVIMRVESLVLYLTEAQALELAVDLTVAVEALSVPQPTS